MLQEIEHLLDEYDIKYERFYVRKEYEGNQDFFPPLGKPFWLEMDLVTTIETNVRKSTYRISKGVRPWFRGHHEIEEGDRVIFEVIEPMRRYRLRIASSS